MNHYERLGVRRAATPGEIKKAFRGFALRWHPDRHQKRKKQAEEKFKEISLAYSVLRDPRRRAEYDLTLEKPRQKGVGMHGVNVPMPNARGARSAVVVDVDGWIDDFFKGPSLDPEGGSDGTFQSGHSGL
jgi:DnaJ-class molecular chaperone